MKKVLYVSDLDGTLLDNESKLTAKTIKIINRAVQEGANFTIATARTPATVSKILAPLKLRLPLIVMTGASLWNMESNEYSDVKYFKKATARKLLELYADTGLPTFVYTLSDGIIHIYHLGIASHIERAFISERIHNPFKKFHLTESHHPGGIISQSDVEDKIILFYAIRPTIEAERTYKRIKNENIDCNALYYHDIYGPETAVLEVFAPEATKAKAVEKLAEKIGADEIVVFGDNVNDLPMMEIATRSVAMGNAIKEVKKRASEVIGLNSEDAVAEYIESRL